MQITLIIASILLFMCIVGIYFVTYYNKLIEILYKVNLSEKNIDELLNNKQDYTTRIINIIDRHLKLDIKEFEQIKNINSLKPTNIDKDMIINEANDKINKVIEDYSELSKVKSFNGIVLDIKKCEKKLITLRNYYNNYAVKYNHYLKKFPYKLIAKIKNFKSKKIYNIKEIDS